jgi:glutathione peroxidase
MTTSIYDIPLKSWDGKENFLSKYKGKVSMIINVTGDCGNAPQFGVIEKIYNKYKDQGFEIVAIPTNDFCGTGVTYGKYLEGIECADDARDYAIEEFGVTYDFSELVVSRHDGTYKPNNKPPHELYVKLTEHYAEGKDTGYYLQGNFEKFLIDREGNFVARYTNGTLLDYAHETGQDVGTSEEEFEKICKDIEATLAK